MTVAGIGIKEHLEVNVCPLSVGLTHRLFSKIMVFFFPQRAHEYESEVTDVDLIYRGGKARTLQSVVQVSSSCRVFLQGISRNRQPC